MASETSDPAADTLTLTRGHNSSLLPPDPSRHKKQLEAIMEIAWAVSSTLDLDSLLPRVMDKVTEIIKADRATFFILDRSRGELWSKALQGRGSAEIRLRVGEGIAGWVAHSGQAINLADAYQDPRFNRAWDERTGYRTKSLLCLPIHDHNHDVVAVIQCLNKQGRKRFDAEDEELLRCVSGQCAVALQGALLYEALLERNRALHQAETRLRFANAELEVLYELERRISECNDLTSLLPGVLQYACQALKFEAGAILLLGDSTPSLVTHPAGTFELQVAIRTPAELRAVLAPTRLAVRGTSEPGDPPVIVPEGAARVRETYSALLVEATGPIGMIQLANRCDDNAAEEWLLRMVSLLAGQVTRAIGVKRERDAGERAERLALLGHSVGALLHDMRTPLSAVGGYTDLMAAEDDGALRLEYVGRIGRALEHMETMAHEVLAFARGQREILVSKVYLNLFVEAVREMLLIETERAGIKLLVEVSYDGLGRFDESKIKRVLFNLARNACQAMQPGGIFTWRVKREHERLVFECADNGPGIPREMEGKLFESFASHGKPDGTGLGLAIAKKIVEAHCGTIECRSVAGEGATFRIELPA
jgi:signal transduction histidine kinase/putative methionine-R-sulfoxide reductase with GAF domain